MVTSHKRHKLLVANRSEIACRVFQACRELEIPTVAVFTELDRDARHITMADEAVQIQSYLSPDEIIRAAVATGVDLIHPGYGFLSERPHFVRAVDQAGLTFIGPRAETMEMMGEKIAAKEIATKAGVPTLPWARVEPGQSLKEAAKKIGYPLLLKAAAGGGGKGMRKVLNESELESSAESASQEAISAFGDGTLFLEKLVERPRHIEIQVFGDGTGGGIHLYERECSLQRRHQKIWEEARAPHLRDETRIELLESALKLVRQVKYLSAGTLEYLVDENENFYFLEMNTRLQVEHPVTELVTGVDLVHAQIMQAVNPDEAVLSHIPSHRGHAIEVRLIAEDPALGFMPTPGPIHKLKWPTGAGIRVDSGIEEGQVITPHFDSMIAKLIVWGQDRPHALARLKYALEETVILGLGTNQSYLRALCGDDRVIEGKVHTDFLDEYAFSPNPSIEELELMSALKDFKSVQGVASQANASQTQTVSPWFKAGDLNGE